MGGECKVRGTLRRLGPRSARSFVFSEGYAQLDVFLGRGCDLGIGFEQVVEGDDRLDDGLRSEAAVTQEPPHDGEQSRLIPVGIFGVRFAAGA